MLILDRPLRTPAAPQGIVSYELAGTLPRAQEILASWGERGRLFAGVGLGLDYLYLTRVLCHPGAGLLAGGAAPGRAEPLAGAGRAPGLGHVRRRRLRRRGKLRADPNAAGVRQRAVAGAGAGLCLGQVRPDRSRARLCADWGSGRLDRPRIGPAAAIAEETTASNSVRCRPPTRVRSWPPPLQIAVGIASRRHLDNRHDQNVILHRVSDAPVAHAVLGNDRTCPLISYSPGGAGRQRDRRWPRQCGAAGLWGAGR